MGGWRAVIYTEAVQAIVLMAGALLISIGAFSRAEQRRLKLVPVWRDYRFQAAALLILTAAVVIAFR